MSFKVIIAGGRDFTDYNLVKSKCDYLLQNKVDIEIVSGACSSGELTFTRPDGTETFGADGLGERYAHEKDYDIKTFPADWDRLGYTAGPIRNDIMARYADACILFWDGGSRGSTSTKRCAKKYKIILREVRYDKILKI